MNPTKLAFVLLVGVLATCYGFKEIQDGARILGNDEINKIAESYSIPIKRKAVIEPQLRDGIIRRLDGVPFGYDDDEFSLLERMKTMEIPPAVDAPNYYSQKYANYPSSSRFALSRHTRSTGGGLKFDDKSSASGPSRGPPPASLPSSSQVAFNGDKSAAGGPGNKEPTEENKRLFPELFGLGGGYPGYYPGGHYGLGHGGYYPHGGHYGGYYPGGGFHGGYPGGHLGHQGASSAAASASASSSSGGGHGGLYNGGFGGRPGLYGGGYYPAGGVAPILGAGLGPYGPGFGGPGFIGGGFRAEDGKGGKDGGKITGAIISASSSDGGKVAGGVSFGDK